MGKISDPFGIVRPIVVLGVALGLGDLTKRVPLARLSMPLEVAQAVMMLLSKAYLTRHVISTFEVSSPSAKL
ncbi:MAG: hypothetical protein EXR05_05070 [Acetobacteraceae bacterium]|nr:hypothetical protein [Acetobacteraceae bacterium]